MKHQNEWIGIEMEIRGESGMMGRIYTSVPGRITLQRAFAENAGEAGYLGYFGVMKGESLSGKGETRSGEDGPQVVCD